jgi:outer membrane protein assembly factor BamB
MPPSGTFDITVFGALFFSPMAPGLNSKYFAPGEAVPLQVERGKIPSGFFDKNLPEVVPDLFIVSVSNDMGLPDAVAKVSGFSHTPGNETSFELTVSDDFRVSERTNLKVEPGIVCLAVQPFENGTLTPSGQLDLPRSALNIFPKTNGSFIFKEQVYLYKTGKDEGDRFRIYNITTPIGVNFSSGPINKLADYIILNYNTYFITSKGSSGNVTYGGDLDNAVALRDSDHRLPLFQPKYTDMRQNETDENYISGGVDAKGDYMRIGGISGANLGTMWFKETLNLGGATNYCTTGACLFKNGIRAFFTLEYTGDGDGLVFALINGNPSKNDTGSAGGDFELSELLGYAGDSRLPPDGTTFLDNSGPKGLLPPKIGVEFDTKVNFSSTNEATGAYCASATSLKENTRNDPGTPAADNRDAVQYVFWGNSSLNVPCRKEPFCGGNTACTGDPSYDDNRHEAVGSGASNWTFDTFGNIQSSPAIATDGTIYVGSDSTVFFAVKPDGTEKWRVNRSGTWFSPTVTSGGRIYVGTGSPENQLYALNPSDGSSVSGFPFPTGGPVTTKPAVGSTGASSGIVYFGSDDGKLYAVRSGGIPAWPFPFNTGFNTGGPVKSSPALSANGNTVYFGSNSGIFLALAANTGAPEHLFSPGAAFQSSPVVGSDGTIYVGNDNGNFYAISASFGTIRNFATGAPVRSSPALSNDGLTVYVGADNGILFALNTSNLSEKWRFTGATAAIQSPIAVDPNDHIYFGSNDNNVYALYFDGSKIWHFETGGDVVAKPAVKADLTVYVGSKDHKLYSINQFANPKNIKDLLITSSGQSVGGVPVSITSEADWLKGSPSKGPWAVRLEIARSQVQTLGTYAYNLRTWVRQCNDLSCNDVLGTFFEDTRVQYSPTSPTARPPMLEQTISINSSYHADFERFLFGFTSQTAAGESQTATIRKFQLSFIQSNDPTVNEDLNWP